ncbi:hypothetical protein VTN49DRAFT_3581 [Thermomyces lanuginosus]|uniref:uncharacterized protein n=1 Tax=Thermomyces lanuginosus TaxID=5541 RepID=UPI0037426041
MLTECASEGVCRGETANLLEGCPRLGIGRDITDQQPFFLGPRICPSVHILGGWPRRGAWDIIECRSLIFWNPASTSDQHVLVMVRKRTGDDVHRTLDEMTTAGWSAGMNGFEERMNSKLSMKRSQGSTSLPESPTDSPHQAIDSGAFGLSLLRIPARTKTGSHTPQFCFPRNAA